MGLFKVGIVVLAATTMGMGCNEQGGTSAGPTAPAASGGADAAADVGETLATVNGMSVGSKEFEAAASRKIPADGEGLTVDEKQEVLDKLVDEKLLYAEALRKGLDKDPKVQKVMVNTLLREAVYANVRNSDFNDEELQRFYDEHKDDFVVPEKAQIKRILIKVSDERPDAKAKSEAEKIQKDLVKDPSKFKELASKFSEDPYRRRGGDVGFVPRSGKPGLDQAVVTRAFEMDVDKVSPVFKTDDGYNIISVANKRERVERTFQQMKGSVLRKVKNERLKNLYEDYVAGLRTGASIDVNQDKLALVEIKSAKRPKGPGFALNPGGRGAPGAKLGPGASAPPAPAKK